MAALPFLPGNTFNCNIGKRKFHKSHHFDICNEVIQQVGFNKPGIGGEPRPDQDLSNPELLVEKDDGTTTPNWLAFDKRVLSFKAFYKESVVESKHEQYRVHNCTIYYYLEDGTIQVLETRQKNSGIDQGTIIKRHRIPKPEPHDNEMYTVDDLNIGSFVYFYGKVFKIVDCDPFTHNFLYRSGVKIPSAEPVPPDPYTEHRQTVDDSQNPFRPYQRVDTLKQFLDHDGHVLRFYCVWDDTDSLSGEVHNMMLYYFLSDDTIEIHTHNQTHVGRDATSVFVRRRKLPKKSNGLSHPGQTIDRTVLNIFGSMHSKGRYILDCLKTGEMDTDFYHCSNLRLGHTINVYGRPFLLCDCDNFTKEYYRVNYGIKDFTPMKQEKPVLKPIEVTFPPYNGFGSEDDSLSNCRSIIPKVPQKDFLKFMKYDRTGTNSHILRFLAKLKEPSVAADKEREFIIRYYLSDDTISVFEIVSKNSGYMGGRFLERCHVKKPGEPKFNTEPPKYYLAEDLFVGNSVEFVNHQFIITDVDEYTMAFMESKPQQFLRSNVELIRYKIKNSGKINGTELLNKFVSKMEASKSPNVFFDPTTTTTTPTTKTTTTPAVISFNDFSSVLKEYQLDISDHEVMVLSRHYGNKKPVGEISVSKLIRCVQERLKKVNFEEFNRLVAQFKYDDISRTGHLPTSNVRKIMLAQNVPISKDLLNCLLQSFSNDDNTIKYEDFVYTINWFTNPYQKNPAIKGDIEVVNEYAVINELNSQRDKMVKMVDEVAYESFVKDICPDIAMD